MIYRRGQRLVAYPDEPLLRRVFIEVTRCARDPVDEADTD